MPIKPEIADINEWINETLSRNAIGIGSRVAFRSLPSGLEYNLRERPLAFSEYSLATFRGLITLIAASSNPSLDRGALESTSFAAFKTSTFVSDSVAYLCKSIYSDLNHAQWSVQQSIELVLSRSHSIDAHLDEIVQDIDLLQRGGSHQDLWSAPLWRESWPTDYSSKWDQSKAKFGDLDGEEWNFWIDWYENILGGNKRNTSLNEKVALLPNDLWEAGAARANFEIMRLVRSAKHHDEPVEREYSEILGRDELKIAISDFDYEHLSSLMKVVPFDTDFDTAKDGIYAEDSRHFIEAIKGIVGDLNSEIDSRQNNIDPRLLRYLSRFFDEISLDIDKIRPARLFDLSKTIHDIILDDFVVASLSEHLVHQIERLLDYCREIIRISFAGVLTRMMIVDDVAPLTPSELDIAIADFEELSDSIIERRWRELPPPSQEAIAIISDLRDEISEVKMARDLSENNSTRNRRNLQLTRKVKVGVSTVLRYTLKAVLSTSSFHDEPALRDDAIKAVNEKVRSELLENPTIRRFLRDQ